MKICIKCSIDYRDDKKFCKNCGAPLSIKPQIDQAVEVKKQVLEEKLKNDLQNVTLLHEYLNFLIKHEISNEALKTALKVLAINESDNIAQDKLFNLYQKLQMHKEAIEAGEQILARKQNDVLLLESLLELSSKMSDDVRILQYSERLLSVDKNNTKGLYQKGLRLIEDKQLSEASNIFEKLASEGNNDRITLIYAAISKVSNANFKNARQALSKVLCSEDIQPNDLDNNRGFLYLAYCLCKLDENVEEIDEWFQKVDFQVLNEEHTGQDEMIAAKTIRELFRKIFAGETINYSTIHRIKLLANQYFDSNSFYFTELTKDIISDIWLLVGEKQLEFKLHKDAFESLGKSIALNSSDLQIIESQAAFKSRAEAIRKKKRKKKFIIFVSVIVIIAFGIAGILYLQYSNQEKAFAKAKTLNTYESFEQYLAFYPDGWYVNEVRALQEFASWEQAIATNTQTSYQQYLIFYPKGKFVTEAEQRESEIAERQRKEKENLVLSAFSYGSILKGEAGNGNDKWPFVLKIIIFNNSNNTWVGELTWSTLNAIHRVEGKVNGSSISFKETDFIKRGNAVIGCIYNLNLDDNEVQLTGTWVCTTGGYVWVNLE